MVQYFPVVTGSLTVNGDISVSGNVAVTGSMSGTSSLAANAELLSGTGSVGFTTTSSFTVASSSLSSRTTQIEAVYATTGSNSFRATQSITGSLTVTGQIIAQTINVQQVTSSIVYSSGSNTFGCDINSRQTFTGSFYQTGSVALFSNNVGIGTLTPCTALHTTIQTCWATNGEVANSYPIATFSQCDCAGGARGLQIGVPTGGVNSPVFLKVNNTGARFSIIDQSNCENFTISGVNVGIGCITPGVSLVVGGTDALKLPTGTTAQRPTGAAGLIRMNTTTGQPEWYNTATSTWASFNQSTNSYLVEYLLVGGGGGGGYDNGAGGGAGGFVLDCGLSVSSCMSYAVVVGGGGSATTGVSGHGGSSCFNGIVALGGGGGGGQTNIGDDGGSGGGSMYYPIGAIRGGFGTIGQGFEGGCWTTLSSPWIGSGGGGASQRGFDGPFNGMGGAGKPSTLLGNTCYYAGGGNGSGDSPGCQTQPLGGGGIAGNPTGGNGSTNSGGGGGGGINGGNYGGNGGSGIVIIRYPGCQRGTGGTICSYCGTTIHVFTSSGTFVA